MAVFVAAAALPLCTMADTVPADTLGQNVLIVQGDTLREVEVRPSKDLPVEDALRRSLGNEPRMKSIGDVLEKLSPGINDKITHPFAIRQRKQERRSRRWQRRLEEFDRVQTFDDLLRQAYENQLMQDSLSQQYK